jgi:hypothetical protein
MTGRMSLAAVLLGLLAGCEAPPPATAPRCSADSGKPMLLVDLFFGRAIHGRNDLTDREWAAFVDDVVTPALPDGFTVFDADGAWMNPVTHKTIHEHSKVLTVALAEGSGALAAVSRIRTAYQSQFHQQLVGMTVQPACGSF